MDCEHVHLGVTNEPRHDPARASNEFTHLWILELRNGLAGLRKNSELFNRGDQLADGNRGIVRGVLTDEGVDCSEVSLGLSFQRIALTRQTVSSLHHVKRAGLHRIA